jgi:hypothetical protein
MRVEIEDHPDLLARIGRFDSLRRHPEFLLDVDEDAAGRTDGFDEDEVGALSLPGERQPGACLRQRALPSYDEPLEIFFH